MVPLYRRATAIASVLIVGLSLPASAAVDPAIQQLTNLLDVNSYTTYQLTVESMGLGLYGGSSYNMGVRNREGWAGPGTLGNQETRLYLTDEFNAMGLDVNVQGSYLNVIGELPGTKTPDDIYIICGHYDHVGGPTGDLPGGDDNASGTAGVLEVARVMSQYDFESTVRFIGFNAEEDGLRGSYDYVNTVVVPGGENIAGVVNLDMILMPEWVNDPNATIDIDLETPSGSGSQDWADFFVQIAADYVPTLNVDKHTSNLAASDHWPFANAGYPAFLAIENTANEIWGGANPYYHTSEDASDRAAGAYYDYDFATDVLRASLATLATAAVLASVPEPTSAVLLVLATGCLALGRRRRANRRVG